MAERESREPNIVSGPWPDALKSGDGGGTFDGMEARVDRLEKDMAELKSDVKAVRLDVAEMKGRLNSMPTTWQLTGLILGIMALSFAIIRFGLAGS